MDDLVGRPKAKISAAEAVFDAFIIDALHRTA
jgi:hypothetical protein